MFGMNGNQYTWAIKTIAMVGNGDCPTGKNIFVLTEVLTPFDTQAHLHTQFDAKPHLEQQSPHRPIEKTELKRLV